MISLKRDSYRFWLCPVRLGERPYRAWVDGAANAI